MNNDDRVLKLSDVIKLTGLSRSSIYNLLARNEFPRRLQITKQRIGFLNSEIQNWISNHAINHRVG